MEILSFLNPCSKTVITVYIVKLLCSIHSPACSPCNYAVNQPIDWPLVNFANPEELHLRVWITGKQFIQHVHPVLRSVVSPCLQQVAIEVRGRDINLVQWSFLDETLLDLIKRHKAFGSLKLRVSARMDPRRVHQFLPRVTQEGVLEVDHTERPDF